MKNAPVLSYLNYYCSPSHDVQFAILIDAPWGAGKTFFIKSFFHSIHEQSKRSDPAVEPPSLYVSLYGVKSIAEIQDQFFSQLHPILDSKTARVVGSVASDVIKKFTGVDASSKAKDLREISSKISKRTLVFDDLERCAMPVSEALGFINSLVEHQKFHVIIICNQNEIHDANFQKTKEKLIGKTLRIFTDAETVYDHMATEIVDSKARDVAVRHKDIALRIFGDFGNKNFRSLRFVLNDFDRLFGVVSGVVENSEESCKQIFLSMLALGFSLRDNKISGDDFSDFNRLLRWFAIDRSQAAPEKIDVVKNVANKVPEVNWRDPILGFSLYNELFSSGAFDEGAAREEAARHPLICGQSQTPSWRKLWNWSDLSREDYVSARHQLIEDIKNETLVSFGTILHAFCICLQLKEYGDALLGEGDVKDYFFSYLDKVRSKGTLEYSRISFDSRLGYLGLGYTAKDHEDFHEIMNKAKQIFDEMGEEKAIADLDILMGEVEKDPDRPVNSLFEVDENKLTLIGRPVLKSFDGEKFAAIMLKNSKLNEQIVVALNLRYDRDKGTLALVDEYQWIETLEQELRKIIDTQEPPFKKLNNDRVEFAFREMRDNFKKEPEDASDQE